MTTALANTNSGFKNPALHRAYFFTAFIKTSNAEALVWLSTIALLPNQR